MHQPHMPRRFCRGGTHLAAACAAGPNASFPSPATLSGRPCTVLLRRAAARRMTRGSGSTQTGRRRERWVAEPTQVKRAIGLSEWRSAAGLGVSGGDGERARPWQLISWSCCRAGHGAHHFLARCKQPACSNSYISLKCNSILAGNPAAGLHWCSRTLQCCRSRGFVDLVIAQRLRSDERSKPGAGKRDRRFCDEWSRRLMIWHGTAGGTLSPPPMQAEGHCSFVRVHTLESPRCSQREAWPLRSVTETAAPGASLLSWKTAPQFSGSRWVRS